MPQPRTGKRNGHTRQRPASKQAKATSRAKPRRGGATRPASAKAATAKTAGKAGKAAKTGKAVAEVTPKRMAGRLALKAAKTMVKKVAGSAAEHTAGGARQLVERAAENTSEAVGAARVRLTRRSLPIQRSVDIAVPLRVAWEEWSALEFLPEGAHTVTEIAREGHELTGETSGPRTTGWRAEILDERPEQSFAWQSHEGSDCAGLITFHRLSERLTRVELNLDVVPRTPAEAIALATRLADRRTETELRRWKARLELINPDVYEDEAPDQEEESEPAPDEQN